MSEVQNTRKDPFASANSNRQVQAQARRRSTPSGVVYKSRPKDCI